MSLGGAIFPAEEDDLEVAPVPGVSREHRLQVPLGSLDGGAVREPPTIGESVDVGVHGKRGFTEGLRHDDAGCLVPDTGQ